jgi:hypothetical protein
MIGHALKRNVQVTGFYPDYHIDKKIPLSSIINIGNLNIILQLLGLTTQVEEQDPTIVWTNSLHLNPTKKPYVVHRETGCWERLIAELRQESGPSLNLNDTFAFNLEQLYPPAQQRVVMNLFYNIPWIDLFKEILVISQKLLGLTSYQYASIHFRLEDDTFLLRTQLNDEDYTKYLYNSYLDAIAKWESTDIFLATHLLKAPNRNNHLCDQLKEKYPKVKCWTGNSWRAFYPDAPVGREIDGIVDYLLCLYSTAFIGYQRSTYSLILDGYFKEMGRPTYLIPSPPPPSGV